jgi:glycosyltransferase involved in cell wall biosynthesis
MVIAVNTSFTAGNLSGRDFIMENFSILAANYPQHQFIFIGDNSFNEKDISSKNTSIISLGAAAKTPLLLQYRLNYKIPSLLRKHKAAVFVSTGYCSLRSKIPQCLVLHELAFLNPASISSTSWVRFYKNNTAKFLSKATTVIATSQYLQQQIINTYKIVDGKIKLSNYGINQQFIPLHWQVKDSIKEKYTAGKEYFLYPGTIEPGHNIVLLLKAFSFFKKRQKSNMQLVLASKNLIADKDFVKDLSTYKYRNEVLLLENITEDTLVKITAAAYALVYPVTQQSSCVPLPQAMQADVPVITSRNGFTEEICGDAALYINPGDFNDIADKMMLLFKDENKRNELIIKGRQRISENDLSRNKAAAVLMESILSCTS